MKSKLIIICLLLSASLTEMKGQISYQSNHPRQFFDRGREMFDNANYAGCTDQLEEFKKKSKDTDLIQESDYMIAVSAYETNNPKTVALLNKFVEKYPWSQHLYKIRFLIANHYFFNASYDEAVDAYIDIDMDRLNTDDQEEYCYRLGVSYIKTNRLAEAKPLFEALAAISQKYADPALFYNTYIAYAEGRYTEALAGFKKLENSVEFGEPSLYYMTQIYFIRDDYAKVIAQGEKLLKSYPENQFNTEVYRLLGESYYAGGDDAQAVAYLKKYMSSEAKPLRSSLYKLGVAEYRTGDQKDAIVQLSKTTGSKDMLTQNAYHYLGLSYLKNGDKKNAQMAFEMASNATFDPQVQEVSMFNYALLVHENSFSPFSESVVIFEKLLNTFPQTRFADQINDYLVEVYLTSKNYKIALASINKIKQPSPRILQAKQRILFQLGTEAFANADFQQAKKYFSDVMIVGNYDPEIKAQSYFWRAECNYRMDDYPQAVSDYRTYLSTTAQKNDQIYALAQYDLGYAYYKQNNFTDAMRWFLKTAESAAGLDKRIAADAYNRVGDCYFYDRNFTLAESYYNKAAAVMPEAADYALFQRGFVAGLQRNYPAKISAMDKLLTDFPNSEYVDDALFEKGRTYIQQDNLPQAETAFQRLVNEFPQSPVSRKAGVQLGLLYFNQSDLDKAVSAYKKVIADYPGSEEAKVAVQDLKSVYLEKNDVSGYANYVKSLGGAVQFAAGEQDSLTYLAAEKLYMRNNLAEAERSLNNYLQSFGNGAFSNNAHYYLGCIFFDAKKSQQALAEFEQVLQVPNNKFEENALARVAEIYFVNQDYGKAKEHFTNLNLKAQSAANKLAAKLGLLRTSSLMKQNAEVVIAANDLLSDSKLSPEYISEARFERAMALFNEGHADKAVADWEALSKDTRNVYGAQSVYRLAQHKFDSGNAADAEKQITGFIEAGTSHQYWLARGFILLADIYLKAGDKFQAKQYLMSLKNNYKGEDDIAGMIEDRLKKTEE